MIRETMNNAINNNNTRTNEREQQQHSVFFLVRGKAHYSSDVLHFLSFTSTTTSVCVCVYYYYFFVSCRIISAVCLKLTAKQIQIGVIANE